jgi:C-terminal processing protease CtpA/Prc
VDLAAAHGGIRFFGAELDGGSADVALADALDAPDALTEAGIAPALTAYAGALTQVCEKPADDRPIPASSVEMRGAVAILHPGTGSVAIPADAAAVAVDLRGLPNRPGLLPLLEASVLPLFTGSTFQGQEVVVEDTGLPAELQDYAGIYGVSSGALLRPTLEFTGSANLPVAILTDAAMGSDASEFAATMRLLRRAFIFGADVRMAVAESCWQGVGAQGVAYRCKELSSGATRWPDLIPADAKAAELDSAIAGLPGRGGVPELPAGLPSDRPFLQVLAKRAETTTQRLGDARAALITAHAAATWFNPLAPEGEDARNAGLIAALDGLGSSAPDRDTLLAALRTYSGALDDGQAFATDEQAAAQTQRLPLVLEQVNGEPVVRVSGDANVHAGDRITAINGQDFATWYQTLAPQLSASTEPHRLERAFERLLDQAGATLTVDNPTDGTRDVTVAGQPVADVSALRKASLRPSGMLAGTTTYYLNADGALLKDTATLDAQIKEAQAADALIVDARGRLGVSPYDLAQRLLPSAFKTPLFHIPVWQGGYVSLIADAQTSVPPGATPFKKKIAILVGPSTVSDAEVFAASLEGSSTYAGRIILVGQDTAGIGGNVTALKLPGGFDFGFTGMEMRLVNGDPFQGIGMAPEVTAAPTQADLASGVDTELEAAKTALAGM